jgi:hypothetical protein
VGVLVASEVNVVFVALELVSESVDPVLLVFDVELTPPLVPVLKYTVDVEVEVLDGAGLDVLLVWSEDVVSLSGAPSVVPHATMAQVVSAVPTRRKGEVRTKKAPARA